MRHILSNYARDRLILVYRFVARCGHNVLNVSPLSAVDGVYALRRSLSWRRDGAGRVVLRRALRLARITRRGDAYVRPLPVHGARIGYHKTLVAIAAV